jgi:acetyl-CoA synthetase (ADP-forming)
MTAHPGEASAHEPGDLARLFAPRSVAVVGASEDAAKVGGRVLKYLADGRYRGRVVAVNPRRTAVMGVPAVPAVAALDAPVDTAIIALPPDACIEAVAQCASAGVGAAVVLTSGFA